MIWARSTRRCEFGSGRTLCLQLLAFLVVAGFATSLNAQTKNEVGRAKSLAASVTIHRDEWGVPHIEGPTDAAVVFGFAYAQCEDFYWQVEDSYIQALGRYAEMYGESGLQSDLLNRAFEVVPKSKVDYPKLESEMRELCEAFVAGLNFYLEKHPDVKRRIIQRYEPWQVLALCRQLNLTLDTVHNRADIRIPRVDGPTTSIKTSQADWASQAAAHMGSNAWAVGPSRTKSKRPILMTNPHQPWYGYGQFYEAHLKSGEGWNFTGACFFGFPLPSIGHNEQLGWAFTFNEPNIVEQFHVQFFDRQNPLRYGTPQNSKLATSWREVVKVARSAIAENRTYEFRKVNNTPITNHAPLLNGGPDGTYSSGLHIPKFNDIFFLRQARKMVRSKNFTEFRNAMAMQQLPIFNTIYADHEGTIYYLYNAIVERRFQQSSNDKGILRLDELPQILNPKCGYLQSCNASPFRTCEDADNPSANDYPYFLSQHDYSDDKRRSKMSRQILRETHDATREDIERKAFDTTSFWALSELPRYKRLLADLEKTDVKFAASVRPYLQHLLNWDCKGAPDGTRMALLVAWYDELYGRGYPAETLVEKYQKSVKLRLQALVDAANGLEKLYGTWKVRWSDIYRIQRHPYVADLFKLPLNDSKPSLPSNGVQGPLGVIFTQYYSPQVQIPFVINLKKRYGVVGTTYLSVVEFTDKPVGKSLLQFGSSGDPHSPHFMDQATLLSEKRLKPQWFEWEDVLKHAKRSYHPGE